MIIGIGNDVVNIDRIKELIDQFGVRFTSKTFTESEIKDSEKFPIENKIQRAAFFAKRFAAKESFAKALGTGFINGLSLKHISVKNDKLGKPSLSLSKKALEILSEKIDDNKKVKIDLSLSDDYPTAFATVIISQY